MYQAFLEACKCEGMEFCLVLWDELSDFQIGVAGINMSSPQNRLHPYLHQSQAEAIRL